MFTSCHPANLSLQSVWYSKHKQNSFSNHILSLTIFPFLSKYKVHKNRPYLSINIAKIPLHTDPSITRGFVLTHSPNSYEGKNTHHNHRPIDYASVIDKSQFVVVYTSSRLTLIVCPEVWFITVAKLCFVMLSLLSGMCGVYPCWFICILIWQRIGL